MPVKNAGDPAHTIHTIGDLKKLDPVKLAVWIGENAADSFRRLTPSPNGAQSKTS